MGLAAFADSARTDPSADLEALHQALAIEHFRRDCRADVVYFRIPPAGEDLDTLAARAARLRAGDLERVTHAALARAHALLPATDMTVCINLVDPTPVTGYMRGVSGAAIGGNRIMILIDPVDEYGWTRLVPYTVTHEYHHEVAKSQFGASFTDGISIMMNEGRADAFATRLNPDLRGPWTAPLDPADEARFWRVAEPHLASRETRSFYRRFMFGREPGLEPWAGYRAAFALVDRYLRKHPELGAVEWTALAPREIMPAR